MSDERGWLDAAGGFAKGVGKGLLKAGESAVEGIGDLARGGYDLATDPAARERAWQAAKQAASMAQDYAGQIRDDPAKAMRDARDGANRLYSAFDQARQEAAARGESAEFWGDAAGQALFEVGTALIPVGAASKAGKLGKAVKAADGLDALGDAAGVAKRAKAIEAGASLPDAPVCVKNCPLAKGGSGAGEQAAKQAAAKQIAESVTISRTVVPKRILDILTDAERETFENAIREVEAAPLKARKDKAIFYSGKVGDAYAWEIAEQQARDGLYDSVNTLSDNLLNRPEIRQGLPRDAMNFIDDLASKKLAEGAEGVINRIGEVETIGANSVFRRIELPALLKNDRIAAESRAELQRIEAYLDAKYGGGG